MPISTDSETWKNAETPPGLRQRTLAFLRDHPNQAYRIEELADELMDATLQIGEERSRLERELTEDEYNQRLHDGELPGGDDYYPSVDLHLARDIGHALSDLIDIGLVERREVGGEVFDLVYKDRANVYTYAGDIDYNR